MSNYESRFYESADGLRLFYRDYNSRRGPTPVLCIPGLTRNSRDFDSIAAHMARTRRVLVADLRGRGRSAYDPEWRHYAVPIEAADMLTLLEAAETREAIVLGTSRGGIIAMAMAAARRTAIKGVILNDVGAEIEAAGLNRIRDFVGREKPFPSWDDAAAAFKRTYAAAFPHVPDARWRAFAVAAYREGEGKIVPDYDPKLGDAVRELDTATRPPDANVNLWPLFAAMNDNPTLVLRGENSDLLSQITLTRMKEAMPALTAVTVANRGHAPFLDEADAVEAIDEFLKTIA